MSGRKGRRESERMATSTRSQPESQLSLVASRLVRRRVDGDGDGSMRLVLQRCLSASVVVDGETVGSIGQGLLVLCGISHDDDEPAAEWACRKLLGLRLWDDGGEHGKAWAQSVTTTFTVILAQCMSCS